VAIFFFVALGVIGLIHYYLWRRLVRNTTRPGRGRRAGNIVVLSLAIVLIGAFVGSRAFPHSIATVLAWPGYLWLALMFYLVVTLLALELPMLAARVWLRRRASRVAAVASPSPAPVPALVGGGDIVDQADGVDHGDAASGPGGEEGARGGTDGPDGPDGEALQSRRLFLARAGAITAGLVAVGVTGSGIRTALGPPTIKRIQIPLAKLPRTADGLRIALVSDIHLGPLRGYGHTRRIVDMINGLDADAVAVVGDLVDGSVAELGAAAAPLRDLRSRLGAYFVTGNHEYFSGYEEWVAEVRELGLTPLRNERVELAPGLDLAGVNDVTGGSFGDGPDFDATLRDRDPAKPVVLMAHQPVQALEAARRGVDLQLSGHTHGGQLWPFHYVVKATGQPVVSGLDYVDGMPVYVTNGAGFWGPPVRVGAPPDITLVELRIP
jgi:predicted MPP superfamily phosphohydrolase